MIRLPALLIAAFALCTADACAQQSADSTSSSQKIPDGPLLRPAPDFYQWTIAYTYPDTKTQDNSGAVPAPATPAKGAGDRPQTITTTKTGKIIHEEIVAINGNKTDAWQIDGSFYLKYPGRTIWAAYEKTDTSEAGGRLREAVLLPPSGFRGLGWINEQTYAGRTQTKYGNSLLFAPGGAPALGGDFDSAKLDALSIIAYINPVTRLPSMARGTDGTRVFTFTALSSHSIQALPEALTAEIQAGNALRAQRNAAPSREY